MLFEYQIEGFDKRSPPGGAFDQNRPTLGKKQEMGDLMMSLSRCRVAAHFSEFAPILTCFQKKEKKRSGFRKVSLKRICPTMASSRSRDATSKAQHSFDAIDDATDAQQHTK